MQVQKISFTSAQTEHKKDSALYSKRGYMDLLRAAQFSEGFLGGFAILESIDKFQLIKNKKNLAKDALKQKAWKHTKYNLLGGIAAGIGSVLLGKFVTNKYLIPMNEKIADWAEKQEKINAKAKELVEAEDKPAETPKTESLKAEAPKAETQKAVTDKVQ